MTSDRIVIRREELFDPTVDEAIARERALTQRGPPPAPELTWWRRLAMSSSFYLPAAAALASFLVWLVVEPGFYDGVRVAGKVALVNKEPFEFGSDGAMGPAVSLTVGDVEVVVLRRHTRLEPAADGGPGFASLDDLHPDTQVEAVGLDAVGRRLVATAIRPMAKGAETWAEMEGGGVEWAPVLLFPLTAVAIAAALVLAEALASQNWVRATERGVLGVVLTLVFSFVAFVPAGVLMLLGNAVLAGSVDVGFVNVHGLSATRLVLFSACRSGAWACIGAALGLGLNLVRSTRIQLRNSVVGGALGGALGGVFFDPLSRFLTRDSCFNDASLSRGVGLVAVGACVGFFVALVDRLAREAWIRVRTGPLAGKSFVVYRTPTTIGSSPRCDVYLFKDAEIAGTHAQIHRVGNRFEIEDQGSRHGTTVGGRRVRRERLQSGDQIVVGATVLDFEEHRRGDAGEAGGAG